MLWCKFSLSLSNTNCLIDVYDVTDDEDDKSKKKPKALAMLSRKGFGKLFYRHLLYFYKV